ncbi:hypothetical protein P368_24305 [Comamonas thiooxydans]|nr:hypothetical protein P369_24040 [Comamonas thiooxydans]KGG92977.1 hypothetical protein P367_23370 [Comamonas thiooxydans]KGH03431.1 hypothetical protein P368_24305 [Comamonas thiooxydans]KGH08539.1 hypothetical protein P365_02590 [Comamonas thiooxydans]
MKQPASSARHATRARPWLAQGNKTEPGPQQPAFGGQKAKEKAPAATARALELAPGVKPIFQCYNLNLAMRILLSKYDRQMA